MTRTLVGRRAPHRRFGLVAWFLVEHGSILEHIRHQNKANIQPADVHLVQVLALAIARLAHHVEKLEVHRVLVVEKLAAINVTQHEFDQNNMTTGLVQKSYRNPRQHH